MTENLITDEQLIKIFDMGVSSGKGGYDSFQDIINDRSNYSKFPNEEDRKRFSEKLLKRLRDIIKSETIEHD